MLGAFFAGIGLAGLAVAMLNSQWRLLGIAVAVISFFAAASVFSNAARIARQLPTLVGKSVRIEAWGKPLEPHNTYKVQSVRVIGAGLHIYLCSSAAKSPRDLKIAQPSGARLTDTQLTIDTATYISLAGTKLGRTDNLPALRVSWPAA